MKKHFIHVMIGILMIGAFAIILNAQEGRGSGRLMGEVLDKNKKPVEGVKLTLDYLQFKNRLETVSDKNGKFGFMGLGMGQIKITGEKQGYLTAGIGTNVSGVSRNPDVTIVMYKQDEKIPEEETANKEANKLSGEFDKAIALYNEAKYDAALAIFEDLRSQKPELYKIGINIGYCYVELQKYDEAIKELQTVLDIILAEQPTADDVKDPSKEAKPDPDLAKIYAAMGDIYMRQNIFSKTEEYFKKSIALSPTDHTLPYNVAGILFAAGKTDEAILYYQLSVKIKPDWPKAYMQLGYAFLNKGDIKASIESFKKFLELAPNAPEADGIKEVIKSIQQP